MAGNYSNDIRYRTVTQILKRSLSEFLVHMKNLAPSGTFITMYEGNNLDAINAAKNGGKHVFPAMGFRINSIQKRDTSPYNEKQMYRGGVAVRIKDEEAIEMLHPIPVSVMLTGKFLAKTHEEFIDFAQSYIFNQIDSSLSYKFSLKTAEIDRKFFEFPCKITLESTSVQIPVIEETEATGVLGETEFEIRLDAYIGRVRDLPVMKNIIIEFIGAAENEGYTING